MCKMNLFAEGTKHKIDSDVKRKSSKRARKEGINDEEVLHRSCNFYTAASSLTQLDRLQFSSFLYVYALFVIS